MGTKEVGHSAIGLNGVAKCGVRRKEIEEGEERRRGERKRVGVNEVDEVMWFEKRKDFSKRGVKRVFWGIVDSLRDG